MVFHNLANYDSHLFVKNLGKKEGNTSCIQYNKDNYISFTKEIVVDNFVNKEGKTKYVKRKLRFIDSLKFTLSSLAKLVNYLPSNSFKNLNFYCREQNFSENQIKLLKKKGIFPYDWFDDYDDEEYQLALDVWKTFNMKTFREYHDLYMINDVILLADVFENFRDVCLNHYKLDPAWYYTAPGLSWDAALKLTKVKLELLTDYEMLMMIEKGTRGGVSTITKRYATANNKYMNNYNPDDTNYYLPYLDANNLYGWAMSKKLPTYDFKWMAIDELYNWKNMPCILMVDLKYPKHLNDLHNDYPLAPEKIKIKGVEKLIPNLNYKEKYVIHHKALKQCLELGLEITKTHKGITFKESN